MRKISIISSHGGPNGAAKMAATLVNGLAARGMAVKLFHRPDAWLGQQAFPPSVQTRPVDIGVRLLNAASIRSVRAEILDWGGAIVHSHGTSADRFASRLRLPGQLISVATAHARILHPHWRSHDAVIAPSAYTADWYRRWHLVQQDRLHLIPNSIPAGAIDVIDPRSKGALRRALGLPADDLTLVMIGDVCHRKNQSAAVPLLAHLNRLGQRATLVIVGHQQRQETERVRARARKLGVAGQIVFTGMQSDVFPYLGASDALISTSRDEQASVVFLEALASGRPLIATPVGSSREAIIPGETGEFFDPRDLGPVASMLIGLVRDAAEQERMARATRRLAETVFGAEQFMDAHLALYDKVAARSGQDRR